MSRCPCKGCDRRTVTCHGFCRVYKEWKAEDFRQKHEGKQEWPDRQNMPYWRKWLRRFGQL